jgi:hypothetical protein
MKRTMMALAAAAGLAAFAGTAAADHGGFAPPRGGSGVPSMGMGGPGTLLGAGDLPPGRGPDCYGWNPLFKRLFRSKDSCGTAGSTHNPLANPANWAAGGYGQGGPAYNPQGFPPGAYGPNGPIQQGTLVFPHHTFVRSPRDYFMENVQK